jgi:TPP-dependent pyruvate/acetoin dehydrogenase alpha subunit
MLDSKKGNASTNSELMEKAVKAFKMMLLARAFEEKIIALYRAGKISGGVLLVGVKKH